MKNIPKLEDPALFGTIGAMMHPAIIARVEDLARKEGLGKSTWVRRLILQHLDALDAENAT